MDLLSISKLTYNRCGLQGTLDSAEGQTGMPGQLVQFVKDAYNLIQEERDEWKFMQQTLLHSVTAASNTIDDSTVAQWMNLYYSHAKLTFFEYEAYLEQEWTASAPQKYTIVPETNQVIVNPLDADYIITSRSVHVPYEMELNSDIPILPTRFHRIIAYKAAADFAASILGNTEVEDKNLTAFDEMMTNLLRSENPKKKMKARPLVA